MKKLLKSVKVNYSHSVGFTADVGGRGFRENRRDGRGGGFGGRPKEEGKWGGEILEPGSTS